MLAITCTGVRGISAGPGTRSVRSAGRPGPQRRFRTDAHSASVIRAGGMLFAALANARPGLFAALVLRVRRTLWRAGRHAQQAPFVDVLGSLNSKTHAIDAHDVDEWGDPAASEGACTCRAAPLTKTDAYRGIASFCPLHNIRPGPKPHMLLSTSIGDARVPASQA